MAHKRPADAAPRAPTLRVAPNERMAAAPGKAVLPEAVREAGFIAAAGGARGGRARLSPLGAEVLAAYREMEAATLAATETRRAWLRARLAQR